MILQTQNSADLILVFSALVGLSFVVLMIWFYINLQSAMNAVSKPNRPLDGGMVWLNLIPVFNFVWAFIFNSKLISAYKKEFRQLKIDEEVRLGAGLVYPVFQILTLVLPSVISAIYISRLTYENLDNLESFLRLINFLYVGLGLATMISIFIFWSQVNGNRRLIQQYRELGSESGFYTQGTPASPQYPTYSSQSFSQPAPPPLPGTPVLSSSQEQFNPPIQHQAVPPIPVVANEPSVQTDISSISSASSTTEKKKEESPVEKLKKYHDLLNLGLITQADFDSIKKEILNNK